LEWRLLYSVARLGSCHLAYITQKTSIDPAHGSRAVSALESKGLIVRQTDPDNRRRKLISLSDTGKAHVDRIWPKVQAVMRSVTDQLEPRDFEEVKRLLDLLNEAAEPLRAKPAEKTTKTGADSIAAE
ncbi:MAG: MarR family winged helix-turn-helix transcriptional regulator, partial [Arenibacterium sp.]